jgi:hypothetical protein
VPTAIDVEEIYRAIQRLRFYPQDEIKLVCHPEYRAALLATKHPFRDGRYIVEPYYCYRMNEPLDSTTTPTHAVLDVPVSLQQDRKCTRPYFEVKDGPIAYIKELSSAEPKGVDPDIHAAATWLVDQWCLPTDNDYAAGRDVLREHRLATLLNSMSRLREAQTVKEKIDQYVPCDEKSDVMPRVARVSIYSDGRVYGYLPRDASAEIWPDFVWPPEEAEYIKRKRAAKEPGVFSGLKIIEDSSVPPGEVRWSGPDGSGAFEV